MSKINEKELKFFLNSIEKTEYCWIWKRAKDSGGYGVCRKDGKRIGAHRFSFLYFVGDIPDGLLIMHTCDNPSCVNPEHLKVGTYKDNTQDMLIKNRSNYKPKFGMEHWNCKLSDEDIIYIKNYPREYRIREKLAKLFNVSPLTIKSIRAGNKERYRNLWVRLPLVALYSHIV